MQNTLKQLSQSELEARYIDNLKKAMDLRFSFQRANRQAKVHTLRQIRVENARIKTLLNMLSNQE